MHVSPVSFQGNAYFSRRAMKTITPEYKQRIEQYAANQPDDMDVFVVGQKTEKIIEYKGKQYSESEYTLENDYLKNRNFYRIKQPDGTRIRIQADEVQESSQKVPVYNAYIFSDTNYSSLDCPAITKEFDFRPDKPSLIKMNNRLYVDDEF